MLGPSLRMEKKIEGFFFFTDPFFTRKRGSSVVRHLPLVLEVPGSIPARSEENFGV